MAWCHNKSFDFRVFDLSFPQNKLRSILTFHDLNLDLKREREREREMPLLSDKACLCRSVIFLMELLTIGY